MEALFYLGIIACVVGPLYTTISYKKAKSLSLYKSAEYYIIIFWTIQLLLLLVENFLLSNYGISIGFSSYLFFCVGIWMVLLTIIYIISLFFIKEENKAIDKTSNLEEILDDTIINEIQPSETKDVD